MNFNRQPAAIVTGIGVIVAAILVYINANPAALVLDTAIVGAIIHYFVTPVAAPVLAPGTQVTVPGGNTSAPTAVVTLQPTAGGPAANAPKA